MADDDRTQGSSRTLPSPRAGAPRRSTDGLIPSGSGSSSSGAGCLTEDQVLSYLEGTTTTKQRDAVDSHLDACQACWLLVDALLGDVRVPSEQLPAPFRI